MVIWIIIKTDKESGEKTLHSAHKTWEAAEDHVYTWFSDVTKIISASAAAYDFETSLFYLEIEEVYLFQ